MDKWNDTITQPKCKSSSNLEKKIVEVLTTKTEGLTWNCCHIILANNVFLWF